MHADVEVRESKIHGKGVFALKDFKPGEIVLVWDTSHEVSESNINSVPESERGYLVRFRGKWLLMQEPSRYVNHSCESNTRPKDGKDVAVKFIKKGEEITGDYRSEMKAGERMQCNCGTPSCGGFIVGIAA